MMSLTVDAIPYIAKNVTKTVKQLNLDILRQIEDDLDIDEKISILFLITEDYTNAFHNIINLFQKTRTENAYIIANYVENYPKNWQDKIMEALSILNNREVIRKLNIRFDKLDLYYVPNIRLCSRNINVIAKCLYKLCESLNENEQELLLSYVKSDISNYESLLNDVNYLELHILYWMQVGYITISKDKKSKMKNLLKHLEKFEDSKIIYLDLQKFENSLNVVDNHGSLGTNGKNHLQPISLEERSFTEEHSYCEKKFIDSGLCVIINQMYFEKEYETRFGTNTDCTNLSETFQKFGFKIVIYTNLKREEMLNKMKNISKDHGNNYDCLFLCILSHGYKGGVMASDEKEVSLEAIEKAVCCMELKDVIKIVLIQACQGKIRGSINNRLATDGLSDPEHISADIRQFTNFFIFMSTMQGFLSIRHKEKGSWFIQEVCNVLKNYGNQLTFFECVRKVMMSVQEKRGTLDGNHVAQLPEIRQDRLHVDFQLKNLYHF
ncbi:caspase-8 isoform X2 [Linepithema humile]|uniref:caspase-8 isoform X2 n=1 Tax=Linepithema humile TaxID=83485 RepID=UPI00351DDF7D